MSTTGFVRQADGFVKDQEQLLAIIDNGLEMYNSSPDPWVDRLATQVLAEQMRVPQSPLRYEEDADGTNPDMQKVQRRFLSFPLRTFTARNSFTLDGYEDMLVQEIMQEVEAGIKGDAEQVTGLMMSAIFTKRTAGSIGTAYQASFWNGETDVPAYGNNEFSGAHSHYAGTNSATLDASHIIAAAEDVAEHGYNPTIGLFSIAQMSDLIALADGTGHVNSQGRAQLVDDGVLRGPVPIAGIQCYVSNYVPAGYFSVLDESVRPLGMREHLNPAYRGLRFTNLEGDANSPLLSRRFRRRTGFGVRHLGAGACRQIVAATSYTNPTMRFS